MMLGIAASSSIAVPMGRRSHSGDSSVRKTAMPKLTGMPISRAMNDVARVPKDGHQRAEFFGDGIPFALVRKPGPKALIAGQLPKSRADNRAQQC